MMTSDFKKAILSKYDFDKTKSGASDRVLKDKKSIYLAIYQQTKTVIVDGVNRVVTIYTGITPSIDINVTDEITFGEKTFSISSINFDGRLTSLILELKDVWKPKG